MKKLIFLFAIACIGCSAYTQNDEPYLVQSLAGKNISDVLSRTSGGSISVTGGNSSGARIEVYVRANNSRDKLSKEEIRERIEKDYDLTVEVSNTTLKAIAKNKTVFNNWKRALNISFKIYVPQNVSTDLNTSGGSIHIAGLTGTQNFKTSGGSLHVDKVAGKIDGKTSGGSISITDSHENIELNTSGGSIRADDCSGTIDLRTSGGSVRLNDLKGNIKASTSGGSVHGEDINGELYAHTSGGRVDLQGLRGSVDASTSGGGMSVEVLELGKYVTIRNSGGSIDLTIPRDKGLDLKLKGDKVSVATLSNFSGKMEEDEINGTLNGGGIPVNVRSSSGRVTLRFN